MPIGSQLVGLHQEPDGPRLQPLDFADTPADDSLEFMGDGRLVRIVPSPIYWSYPNQPDKEEDVMPMVFYRTSSGDWRVADVDS